MTEPAIVIRPAEDTRADLTVVDTFIRELAAEEGLPSAIATIEDLTAALFGPDAVARAVIAVAGGEPAGFALFYPKYSTVSGRRGIHLEDVYIAPAFRGRRVGTAILDHLQDLAGADGMVDWWVLRNNDRAIGFYERVGARELDGIAVYRRDHPESGPEVAVTGLASSETVAG